MLFQYILGELGIEALAYAQSSLFVCNETKYGSWPMETQHVYPIDIMNINGRLIDLPEIRILPVARATGK